MTKKEENKLLAEYRKKHRALADAFIAKKLTYDEYQTELWTLRRIIESRWPRC